MTDTKFQPIERGPQRGSPPSLEFVALDRLQVDPAYQRAVDGPQSRRIIVGMVKQWDWALCQPLVVSRRADGSLWILDGQHRHAGAVERGDIHHLPCTVLPELSAEHEARAFVDLNTRRQRLTQMDIFVGMLAAGDETAKAAAELLDRTNWRIRRGNVNNTWKPGEINFAPMITRSIKRYGHHAVEAGLSTVREAWPDKVVDSPARMLEVHFSLLREGGVLFNVDRQTIAGVVSAKNPFWWIRNSLQLRLERPGLSLVGALSAVILDAVKRKPVADPQRQIRPVAPAPIVVTSDEPRWCEQCEQRVSASRVASCASPFCKMKAAA
jgi:hypothetical protein